jgi:hypothetical protein
VHTVNESHSVQIELQKLQVLFCKNLPDSHLVQVYGSLTHSRHIEEQGIHTEFLPTVPAGH